MTIKNIDCATLKKWLDNDEALLIDVREAGEYKNINIPKSYLLPLGNISIDKIPPYSNKKLVIHCHSGKRSLMACQKLLNENSNLEIYNLEGGICAWQNSGCHCNCATKFFLPLDRQIQVSIGFFVLLGAILGFFIDKNFIFLSAFFGAGLIYAGLTGTCYFGTLLSKMPHNKKDK
ncbi:MAG: DUF2892 domain-containing protein [Proteobacteria bacterium]|nr:DUF2892 domain-containing protein [Pseudomonadota bacterium]NCA27887.1 DUF2892 domain-containing protein [Pseudomonadota bacterium]